MGDNYSYTLVDGVQAYIPLGAENDSRATMGRVKEHTGSQFAILTSGKPPYHKDSYTSPGTYTWTCPYGDIKRFADDINYDYEILLKIIDGRR